MAWQLANELKREIYKLTRTRPAAADLKYCDQIKESSRSVSANIAEGFWRFHHKEFARFLIIARGSLGETEDHLQDGVDRGHLDAAELQRLSRLVRRTQTAIARLHAYLRTTPDRSFAPRR